MKSFGAHVQSSHPSKCFKRHETQLNIIREREFFVFEFDCTVQTIQQIFTLDSLIFCDIKCKNMRIKTNQSEKYRFVSISKLILAGQLIRILASQCAKQTDWAKSAMTLVTI